jgi:gamma-glutamylputrescine oxidase
MSGTDLTVAGWYEATRVERPDRPRLNFDLDVDVCVVGAGLAGLTAAREIARRGWSVAVLEGGQVGWAASGRNTGFVLPGFGAHIDDIVERVGLDHAKELWALSEQGVDYVRRTIADNALPAVDPTPGWLHVSKTDNDKELDTFVERLRWIGAHVENWPAERVRAVLPNPRYFSAVYYPDAFHIHPLNYTLGLAALAEKAGARIFEGTPAVTIDGAGVRKRIGTPGGMVRAGHVVLAGNIHLGNLMPRLAATLLPVSTFVMVTEPIEGLQEVLRTTAAVSDTNRADNHYRIVGENRLQWSGRMRAWQAEPRWIGRSLAADIRRHGLNTSAMGGELVARGMVDNDQTWRLFAPYELVWAGGALGSVLAQGIYWGSQPVDAISQSLSRYRERRRARKALRLARKAAALTPAENPASPPST